MIIKHNEYQNHFFLMSIFRQVNHWFTHEKVQHYYTLSIGNMYKKYKYNIPKY